MRLLFLILLSTMSFADDDFFIVRNLLSCKRSTPIDEIKNESGTKDQQLKSEIVKHVDFQKKLLGQPAIDILADSFVPMIGGKAYFVSPQQTIETTTCQVIPSVKVFKQTESTFCPKDILVEIGPQETGYLTKKGIIRSDSSPVDCSEISRQAFAKVGYKTIWRDANRAWMELTYPATTVAITTSPTSQELVQIKQIMTKIFDKELSLEADSHFRFLQSIVFESFQSAGTIIMVILLFILAFFRKLCKKNTDGVPKMEIPILQTGTKSVSVEMEKSKFYLV